MGFKEQIQEDMEKVFFNEEEFAELHSINGREILVVEDSDELAALYIGRDVHTEQLFRDSILFHVRKGDLGMEPVTGMYLEYDGRCLLVTDVKEDEGMYTIILEVNGH